MKRNRRLGFAEWESDTPTGSDVDGLLGGSFPFHIENEAVNLLPFVGLTAAPNDSFFVHAFAQVDVPAQRKSADNTACGRSRPDARADLAIHGPVP